MREESESILHEAEKELCGLLRSCEGHRVKGHGTVGCYIVHDGTLPLTSEITKLTHHFGRTDFSVKGEVKSEFVTGLVWSKTGNLLKTDGRTGRDYMETHPKEFSEL